MKMVRCPLVMKIFKAQEVTRMVVVDSKEKMLSAKNLVVQYLVKCKKILLHKEQWRLVKKLFLVMNLGDPHQV